MPYGVIRPQWANYTISIYTYPKLLDEITYHFIVIIIYL